jgi:hypothetical protein
VNVLKRNDGLARGGVHPGTWLSGLASARHCHYRGYCGRKSSRFYQE